MRRLGNPAGAPALGLAPMPPLPPPYSAGSCSPRASIDALKYLGDLIPDLIVRP